MSRDLMDFMVGGTVIKELNKVIIFLNPTMRGLDKIFRSVKDPAMNKALGAKALVYLVIPGILNSLMMALPWVSDEDREEYLNAPDYQRNLFHRIPIGGGMSLFIPRPFELAALTSIAQRITDKYFLGDEGAIDAEFAASIAEILLPTSKSQMMSGYSGIIATLFNYDFFRKKHIIPAKDEDISMALRNTEYASKFGKLVQEMSGLYSGEQQWDARKVDAFITGQFSYWGNAWLKLTEAMLPGESMQKYKPNITMTGYVRYANAYAEPEVQNLMGIFKKHPYTKDWDEYQVFSAFLDAYFADDAKQDTDIRRQRGAYLRSYSNSVMSAWKEIDFNDLDQAQKLHNEALRNSRYNRTK
jgi:hypothetical protein